jgi:HK97 family phage major capsid protein
MAPSSAPLSFTELRDQYNEAKDTVDSLADQLDTLLANPEADKVEVDSVTTEFHAAVAEAERREELMMGKDARERARAQFQRVQTKPEDVQVREPDMYRRTGPHSFMSDLFQAQVRGDMQASSRIDRHQQHEIEKRAMTSATFGGVIPPAYLLDLYAKASRNGRVFADQCNQQTLPDVGMSLIVPRITTATAAGIQATENSAATTQDAAETDLTVNVRTIAGYVPVSRQGIERAAYSDQILFEDLIARYWAQLDTQCISGGGGSGTILGVLSTSSISTSTASTATVAGVYPKIADLIQQINSASGGLGYVADKIFMHPRRWGFFEAALDTQNRPLMLPTGGGLMAFNPVAGGQASGYGEVGVMHGLRVFTDANIPINLGTGTNEDRIIVMASNVVHLWERDADPVTLSFEQQAGTSLQVQLIVYGYAAFSAGRYPASSGVVSGAGLATPTF